MAGDSPPGWRYGRNDAHRPANPGEASHPAVHHGMAGLDPRPTMAVSRRAHSGARQPPNDDCAKRARPFSGSAHRHDWWTRTGSVGPREGEPLDSFDGDSICQHPSGPHNGATPPEARRRASDQALVAGEWAGQETTWGCSRLLGHRHLAPPSSVTATTPSQPPLFRKRWPPGPS